jgi:hypothetical protein
MASNHKTLHFVASSGNECRITESPHGFLLDWQSPQSREDQHEFTQWANKIFGSLLLQKWGYEPPPEE